MRFNANRLRGQCNKNQGKEKDRVLLGTSKDVHLPESKEMKSVEYVNSGKARF